MDHETKEKLREAAQRRARCGRCGGRAEVLDGAQLSSDGHFPGVRYKVCRSCGFEAVLKARKTRG